mmetsp:Transcript_9986/g.21763  ORF Transcript_9986/g.21763 Transcript_9986/m.21763 type:complete len:617 (-) Transcript_9986:28-1878(-)
MAMRGPPQASSAYSSRRAQSRSPSPPAGPSRSAPSKGEDPAQVELKKRIRELEGVVKNEHKEKQKDDKKRQKELAEAKRKITKELQQATRVVRKNEQEVNKVSTTIHRLEDQAEQAKSRKDRTTGQMEDKISTFRSKRNSTEETLQEKMANLGEARGRLAHIQFAQKMLEQGVIVPTDGTYQGDHDLSASMSRSPGMQSEEVQATMSYQADSRVAELQQENFFLRQRLQQAEAQIADLMHRLSLAGMDPQLSVHSAQPAQLHQAPGGPTPVLSGGAPNASFMSTERLSIPHHAVPSGGTTDPVPTATATIRSGSPRFISQGPPVPVAVQGPTPLLAPFDSRSTSASSARLLPGSYQPTVTTIRQGPTTVIRPTSARLEGTASAPGGPHGPMPIQVPVKQMLHANPSLATLTPMRTFPGTAPASACSPPGAPGTIVMGNPFAQSCGHAPLGPHPAGVIRTVTTGMPMSAPLHAPVTSTVTAPQRQQQGGESIIFDKNVALQNAFPMSFNPAGVPDGPIKGCVSEPVARPFHVPQPPMPPTSINLAPPPITMLSGQQSSGGFSGLPASPAVDTEGRLIQGNESLAGLPQNTDTMNNPTATATGVTTPALFPEPNPTPA